MRDWKFEISKINFLTNGKKNRHLAEYLKFSKTRMLSWHQQQ